MVYCNRCAYIVSAGVLPYNMSLTAETPLSEPSVELLILQVDRIDNIEWETMYMVVLVSLKI